jgi:hypothetical protein
MASPTDYRFAGTAANVDRDSKTEWQYPDYAKADDTNYAQPASIYKSDYGDWLRLTNFGFTSTHIPDGATINGIEIVICRNGQNVNEVNDSALYLYANGAVGNNLASATKWPNTESTATYGGPTDMCGTSLTQANIIASTFGVQLSVACGANGVTFLVDYIKIRVYYTEGGGATVKPHYYYLQQ